ncbi:spore germination protein [Peribacillus frigoritolerans]|nr:spore germination protein [Peribacillus frigoritolerans]
MPAIIGPVQVFNVAQGNLLFGDCAVISPKSSSKSVFRIRFREHSCNHLHGQWSER